jgi:hypothetical protein
MDDTQRKAADYGTLTAQIGPGLIGVGLGGEAAMHMATQPARDLAEARAEIERLRALLATREVAQEPDAWICTKRLTGDKAVFDIPCTTANKEYVKAHPAHDWKPLYAEPKASALPLPEGWREFAGEVADDTMLNEELRNWAKRLLAAAPLLVGKPTAQQGGATQAAGHEDDIESVIACLGDDAAGLREENPECEIAKNMEIAAATLRSLCRQLDEARKEPDRDR